MSLEVPAESVGTIVGVQSWRQRIAIFRRCNKEAIQVPNNVCVKRTVSRLILEDLRERAGA